MSLLDVKHSGPSVGHLDSRYVNVTGDTMTGGLTINTNSTTALKVEQTGVNNNTLVIDTTNGRLGINATPLVQFDVVAEGINGTEVNIRNYTDAIGTRAVFKGRKAHGTLALPTDITTNDALFSVLGDGYFGGSFRSAVSIDMLADGTWATNSYPTKISFWTNNSTTARTERMRLNALGNLLIGTTSSLSNGGRLQLVGGADAIQLIVKANATQTTNLQEWQNSSGTVLSSINKDGWLGLGITPTVRLDVDGDIRSNYGRLIFNGIVEPTAPTVALAGLGAGNLGNGVYKYAVTFVTALGETGLGTVATITVVDNTTNGRVALSAIPTGSSHVTSRKIYRTAVGGSAYFLLTTINDNTTTTYTDNTADGSLGTVDFTLRKNTTGGRFQAYDQRYGTVKNAGGILGNNVGIGVSMFNSLTAGQGNSGLGTDALASVTTASNNMGIGGAALNLLTTGNSNVAVGTYALAGITTGSGNVSIGHGSFASTTQGSSNNVAIGQYAGYSAGANVTSNLFLGGHAGRFETGSNKLMIDALNRTNEATGRTNSMFYGVFSATVSSQTLNINAGTTITGYGSIVGNADVVQLRVKAHSTQTTNLLELHPNSSSTPLAYFGPLGSLRIQTATTVQVTLINTEASGSSTGAYINLYERDGAPLVSGDRLGGFIMGGSRNVSDTTNNSVAFNAYAIETWSDTQAGARCTFEVCPSGSITRTVIAGIYGNGMVLGTTTSAPTGLLQLNGIADAVQLVVKGNATQTTNLQEWQNSSGTNLANISGTGEWGIGTASATTSKLKINFPNSIGAAGTYSAVTLTQTSTLTADEISNQYGVDVTFTIANGTYKANKTNAALIFRAVVSGSEATAANGIIGIYGGARNTGTGTVVNAVDFFSDVVVNSGGGAITNSIGYSISNKGGTGVTNAYGIRILDQSGASSTNYALYTNAGLNNLGDQLKIDGSADRIQLIVQGHSTQTANLQEWQNSSGTVLAYVEKAGLIKSSGRKQAVAIKSADYTLTINDEVVVFTATATATLPAATGTGQTYRIVCRAGTLTIDGNGTDTIKGSLTQTLTSAEDLIITDTATGIWE